METTTTRRTNAPSLRRTRKKKMTKESVKVPNSQKPPRNKYTEAALKHQGSFIVYDPNFML